MMNGKTVSTHVVFAKTWRIIRLGGGQANYVVVDCQLPLILEEVYDFLRYFRLIISKSFDLI